MEWLSLNWKTYFSSSSSSTWKKARRGGVLHLGTRNGKNGTLMDGKTKDGGISDKNNNATISNLYKYKETCTECQSDKVLAIVKFTSTQPPFVVLRIPQIFCSFWPFRVQTVATAMNATERCTENTSPYARMCTFFSLRTSHVTTCMAQDIVH